MTGNVEARDCLLAQDCDVQSESVLRNHSSAKEVRVQALSPEYNRGTFSGMPDIRLRR